MSDCLKSIPHEESLDGLQSFLERAVSRSVIGLGESTHGTREAFQLKHRLIRALAEQRGLRTVAFECGFAAGRLVDGYVRWGLGSAREALGQQGYWCWENLEVLELIEWLRKHNSELPSDERIAFVGIDVQKVESGLSELLAAFDRGVYGPEQDPAADGPGAQILLDAAGVIRSLMAGKLEAGDPEAAPAVRTLFEAAPRLPEPGLTALCRNVARYIDTYLNTEREDGLAVRDEYLAATVLEVLAESPGLMVIWAHNEHVAVNPDFFGTRAMGHHLREALGETYLAVGMLFGAGAFLARSWGERSSNRVDEFRVGRAGEGHVEHCFLAKPFGLYGSTMIQTAAGAQYRRYLGSLYDPKVDAEHPDAFRIERPLTDFDLLAWLPVTHAARYLGDSGSPPGKMRRGGAVPVESTD